MSFDAIHPHLKGIPFITEANARRIYDFILQERPECILELGFAHGTSTCYLAAALREVGRGKVVAVDLKAARAEFDPGLEELAARLDLEDFIEIHRMQTGYNWFLHDEIQRQSFERGGDCKRIYDLIILDGAKNWTIDSSAFFLADKLLKKGGWFIFDDYSWTYADADGKRAATDGVTHRELSEAERKTPHIREIFHLLVMPHPHYGNFRLQVESGDWAWAQKTEQPVKTLQLVHTHSYRDYGTRATAAAFGLGRRLLGRRRGVPESASVSIS